MSELIARAKTTVKLTDDKGTILDVTISKGQDIIDGINFGLSFAGTTDRVSLGTPQSEWISVDEFNPAESCHVHAYCNDIVNGWVELLHVYVCPEYGNHTIETLDHEDYPAIITHVKLIKKPEPPKC